VAGLPQRRFRQAEDRGAGANPERERHNRDGRERRRPFQLAHAVAQIGGRLIDKRKPIACRQSSFRASTPPNSRRAASRIGRRHAGTDQVFDVALDVESSSSSISRSNATGE
jgi:hypothetical protein